MTKEYDGLCYHGRRSVDELIGALQAEDSRAALIHKELSLLHLDRFIAMMTSTADSVRYEPASQPSLAG